MDTLFELAPGTAGIRCPVTFEHWAECSLEAGHDGEHRGYVSHDLSRAYVVIPDPIHTNGSGA